MAICAPLCQHNETELTLKAHPFFFSIAKIHYSNLATKNCSDMAFVKDTDSLLSTFTCMQV